MNKYHNYDEKDLTVAQKVTQQEILRCNELSAKEIEQSCTGFLTNVIYSNVVSSSNNLEQGREKSFEIAANAVLKNGEKIEEQLRKNDAASLNATSSQNADQNQSQTNQNQPNTSEDVKKISGGTMAKIISKIAEIMAAMSPEEQKASTANFAALFVVLERSFDKVNQTMSELAKSPVVVASIKDSLEGTRGQEVLEKLITTHLKPEEQKAVNQITEKDLKEYKQEMSEQRKSGLSNSL